MTFTRKLLLMTPLLGAPALHAQTNAYLDSTRPTVSSDAAIQQKGVLQFEEGYDGYFHPFDQTAATNVYYALTSWLRLDAAFGEWRDTDAGMTQRTVGVGTSSVGAKAILFHDGRSKAFPGVAIEYEDTLATASRHALQSRYHQGTLILSNTAGAWKWKVNGSAIGSGCNSTDRCSVHGQGAVGLSYTVDPSLTVAGEFFGQTNSVRAPPGAYAFGGLSCQLNRHTDLNGGVRLGVTPSAPRVGATLGLTVAFGGHPSPSTQ